MAASRRQRTDALGVSTALALAQPANPPQQQPPQQPPQQSYPKDAKATDQGAASLTAKLVEMEEYAAHGAAAVEVQVVGLKLTDPATVGEKPAPGQGHIHYQIDDGPIIATIATDLIFHQLKPGPHKLKVMLAAKRSQPAGPFARALDSGRHEGSGRQERQRRARRRSRQGRRQGQGQG
jgi:hypothetical protein